MFNFGFDKKTIIIALVVMAVLFIISGGTQEILNTLLIIPGVLLALTFHEFAHAFVAVKLGDETPKLQGRLNLNPISHIDIMGFILLVVAGFGWGKSVEIQPRNFSGKYSISKAEAIVSAAGPIMNFLLAFLLIIIYYIVFKVTNITAGLSVNVVGILILIIQYAISINIGLGVFNLIPLPPLDGSKILSHFLPYNSRQWFYNNSQLFYMIFLLIWISGLSSKILSPIVMAIFNGMEWIVYNLINLFM